MRIRTWLTAALVVSVAANLWLAGLVVSGQDSDPAAPEFSKVTFLMEAKDAGRRIGRALAEKEKPAESVPDHLLADLKKQSFTKAVEVIGQANMAALGDRFEKECRAWAAEAVVEFPGTNTDHFEEAVRGCVDRVSSTKAQLTMLELEGAYEDRFGHQ